MHNHQQKIDTYQSLRPKESDLDSLIPQLDLEIPQGICKYAISTITTVSPSNQPNITMVWVNEVYPKPNHASGIPLMENELRNLQESYKDLDEPKNSDPSNLEGKLVVSIHTRSEGRLIAFLPISPEDYIKMCSTFLEKPKSI